MVDSLWVLVEDLIRWQKLSAAMNAAGFLFVGVVLSWVVIKVRRIERAVCRISNGKYANLLKPGNKDAVGN